MLKQMCRAAIATGVALAVIVTGLAFAQPASAATATAGATVSTSSTTGSTGATDTVGVASDVVAPTSGLHRIWISVDSVTASTTDDTVSIPTDRASATAFVASLNSYWNRETGGAVTIALGGFEVRAVPTLCSVSALLSAARSVDFGGQFATTASWTGTNNHLLVLSREPCSSSSVGQGTVGGGGGIMATAVGSAGSYGLAVAAHEFGHNLGFMHANVDTCPVGVDSGSSCATTAYTDYLDVMGGAVAGSLPHVSTPQLISLGYLHDFASLSQTSGVVQQQLQPVGAGSGTRSIRITDPATGEQYFVEYRIADAADAASPEFGGNLSCTAASNGRQRCWGGMSPTLGGIRVLRVGSDGTSVLSIGSYGSTHLDLGQTFENFDDAFKITVSSLSPTAGAQISVAFGSSITPTDAAVVTAPTGTAPAPVSADASEASATVTAPAVPVATPVAAGTPGVVWSTMHVAARLRHSTIRHGAHPVVIAVVTGASQPTGKLTVWASGHRMRTVSLRATDRGVRAITLPARTKTGKLSVRVTYSGNSKLEAAASVAKRLTVR
jgi:hypothetical protein